MRCPSCGTENAPGSRFCGGCGAKLASSRVAPTQKISDEAPLPQVPMSRPPPVTAPGIAPPQAVMSTPFSQMGQAGVQPIASGVQRSGTPIPASAWPPPSQPPPMVPRTLTPPPAPRTLTPGSQPPIPRTMSQPPGSQPHAMPPAPQTLPPGAPLPLPPGAPPPPRTISRPPTLAPAYADEPDVSLPTMARRPWGWIIVVLLLDIGLAAAGSWMLYTGLGDRGDPHSKAP